MDLFNFKKTNKQNKKLFKSYLTGNCEITLLLTLLNW